jgi:hypothetical protein
VAVTPASSATLQANALGYVPSTLRDHRLPVV